jgi:uncharacterized protein (DUF1778 family)
MGTLQNKGEMILPRIVTDALREAKALIEEAERVTLSERDTRLWLDLLENPPKPNARLIAAVKALTRL